MVRTFSSEAVPEGLLTDLVDLMRRAPSAGNTQPLEVLVLRGPAAQRYWSVTLGDRRDSFRWQGMVRAPVLVIPYVRPAAYPERYAEADKATTGLGEGVEAWSVPYWWVDGGAAVENLLLAAHAAGLGACLFGQFEHEAAVREAFGVPPDRRALGTVAIGRPLPDEPGRSAGRARPALGEVVHRDRW
jgi:nitroreductase